MGSVVDLRPDRFLRAMRDTGDWVRSCELSGMSSDEVEAICKENPGFDLAQVECQLEHQEEEMIAATEKVIAQAREQRTARLNLLRDNALARFKVRHPETQDGG